MLGLIYRPPPRAHPSTEEIGIKLSVQWRVGLESLYMGRGVPGRPSAFPGELSDGERTVVSVSMEECLQDWAVKTSQHLPVRLRASRVQPLQARLLWMSPVQPEVNRRHVDAGLATRCAAPRSARGVVISGPTGDPSPRRHYDPDPITTSTAGRFGVNSYAVDTLSVSGAEVGQAREISPVVRGPRRGS